MDNPLNSSPLPQATEDAQQTEKWRINTHICIFLAIMPTIGVIGAFYVPLTWKTFWFSVFYYYVTGLGITAGHHRLWAHRSYNASTTLEVFLALAASGAVEGSIKWWCQEHRAHHRYTDTDNDPYSAERGFWWSHIGWLLMRPPKGGRRSGWVDIEDLKQNKIIIWQDRLYLPALVLMCYVVPTVIPWKLWGDAWGGFIYASVLRLCVVQHSSFCVNSLAHWLGDAPFDDKHTPRDHLLTALITIGEGYHNFHHQFPMDYRNAIKWYQYDPTKWFIWTMGQLGLANQLKVFPENEVRKGQLAMQLKKLRQVQDDLKWPTQVDDLPIIDWKSFKQESSERSLVLIAGFIHDLTDFADEHPGGAKYIKTAIGKDVTASFFGGVYAHSNAAHNLLSMRRVGILHGGYQTDSEKNSVPPGQSLKIVKFEEFTQAPKLTTRVSS